MTDSEKVQVFLSAANGRLGCVSLWGAKGPDTFDCSGLVSWSLLMAGFQSPSSAKGKKRWSANLNWNAQRMANDLPHFNDIRLARAGDLCFYGDSWDKVTHVTIFLGDEGCLSASGATSKVTSLERATQNKAARIRKHTQARYRSDFLGWGSIRPYLEFIS